MIARVLSTTIALLARSVDVLEELGRRRYAGAPARANVEIAIAFDLCDVCGYDHGRPWRALRCCSSTVPPLEEPVSRPARAPSTVEVFR